MFRRAIGFLLIAVFLIAGLWISQRRVGPLKVSGLIEADEIRLGSRVGGRVQAVLVEEGQQVKAGDLLVELEPFDLAQRRAEAEAVWNQRTSVHQKLVEGFRPEETAQALARLDQAKAQLLMLQHGPRKQEIETAQAELDLALAEQALAEEVFVRIDTLRKSGATTQDVIDRSRKERDVANQLVIARRQQWDLLKEGTRAEEKAIAEARVRESEQAWELMKRGSRSQDIAEAYAAMRAAESGLAAIDKQLEELQVRAPTSGTIEAIDLRPGTLVSANAPVVSLVDTTHLWVRAYVPENQLDIALGQQRQLTVDSFPGERFTGEITFIARQAEFTPGNVQTPEERSKQVFRIKLTLRSGHEKLRPGMAADIWLEAHP